MARRRRPNRRPPARRAPRKRGKQTAKISEEVEVVESEAVDLRPVAIPDTASISEIAERSDVPATDIIMELLNRGVLTTINAAIDRDTARLVMANLGIEIVDSQHVMDDKAADSADDQEGQEGKVSETTTDDGPFVEDRAEPKTGEPRPPVVTVMGHVDHGKTTLLDAIRQTNVVDSEFGGITQHIVQVTDIAIIVVAADDGVMPQTVEAIGHAKAAGVPIIVAVNKIDLEGANPDRVLQQLTEHEIVVEKFGGDVVAIPLSALQGEGIDNLLEYVQLTAELEDLRSPVDGPLEGTIIETRLDHSQGAIATVLLQQGTLKVGDSISTGSIFGRVRALFDDTGGRIKMAGPSTPVEVVGLETMPDVGDSLRVVKPDRKKRRRKDAIARGSGDQAMRLSLESLASQMTAGRLQQINLVVKADTAGSVDAVVHSVNQLGDERARAMIVYEGVGPVNESDINLASAAKGLVLGFNVRADVTAEAEADRQNVQIRLYRTIYELIDDVDASLKGSIKPEEVDVVDGRLEIRGEFRSERNRQIVGGMVLSGRMHSGGDVRILRGDDEVGTGTITTLRRFSDETDEVREGFDCGLSIVTTTNIQLADIIEAHHTEERFL
jgi:translation initiation factor IF-2